jgi:MFS family permease
LTRRVEVAEPFSNELERAVASRGHSWTETSPLNSAETVAVTAEVGDGEVKLAVTYEAEVPYFGWVFNGLNRATARSFLRHLANVLRAESAGETAPPPPKAPWWAPPDAMSPDQVRAVATISLLLALVEYGNSLLTQTVDFVAKTYSATNADLGLVTALTRVGNLIVLVGGIMADRAGRRRLLLASVSIVLTATVLSGLAPSLATFGVLQVFVNGATNLAFMVGIIAAVEEAPEASRAYTIAIVGIAAGLGFVLSAVLLPVADARPQAWRGLYLGAAIGFLFLPSVSRSLKETKRFEALVARNAERGRVGEVVDRTYGRRFVLMCVTGFLLNLFFAPQGQFTNRYLSDERGFSGFGILTLRAVTQAVPAFVAAYLGGKLAETKGRRPIARQGLILGAIGSAVFFVAGGPALWTLLAIGTIGLGIAGPALSSFSTELFPTEVRGTAGAGLTLTSVLGSATGLLLAGYLSAPLGSIGRAVAVLAIGPLVVAVFLIRYLPEAKGKLLDDVSPSEV